MQKPNSLLMRLAAVFMCLVMMLTLLPALSTPAEAITADDVNYSPGAKWYSIEKGGGDGHTRLEMLSILLRYQKNDPAANKASDIPDSLASYFDASYTGDTLYIRLEYDIEVEFNVEEERDKLSADTPVWDTANWHCNLPVCGNKVLDLNGHTIKVWAKDGADCAFEIRNGATLTVVDSKGGGKMLTDTYIYGVGGGGVIDLFHVKNGGELILNAPDAEFECGRSKKQTYYGYAKNGKHKSDGGILTVRGQSNGNAVLVEDGGSLTVAGGTLRGRGYSVLTKYGSDWNRYGNAKDVGAVEPVRCAAITARSGAAVRIIDGVFLGKGCADALSIELGAELTIESGEFDVSKVDRVALPSASNYGSWIDGQFVWTTVNHSDSNYMDGSDGHIGISDSVLTALAKEKGASVDIIQGGQTIAGSELDDAPDLNTDYTGKAVTIRPRDRENQILNGSFNIQLMYGGGIKTLDPVHQDSFKVTACYDGYYSDVARKLIESDYRTRNKELGKNDVEHYYDWSFALHTWTLYNGATKKVSDLCTMRTSSDKAEITFDLLELAKFSREDWKKIENGSWTLHCEVTEVWKGEHTYEISYYKEVLLQVDNDLRFMSELMNNDFELGVDIWHTQPLFNGEDGLAQYLTCALDEDTQTALENVFRKYQDEYLLTFDTQKIRAEYEAYRYGSSTFSWWGRYGYGFRSELTSETLAESAIGPMQIFTRLWIPEWQLESSASGAMDAGTYRGEECVESVQNFLYLPAMTMNNGSTRTRVGFDNPLELPDGANIEIEPNKTGWLEDFKAAHPGTVSWQWYKSDILDLDVSEQSFWRNVEDGIYIPYDTDDQEEGSVVLLNSGTYRLVMTFTPQDGTAQKFLSVPIEIHGSNAAGLSAALYSSDTKIDSTYDLENSDLILELSEGAWNQVDSIRLRMMSAPAGVKRSTAVDIPVVKGQRKYTVKFSQFDGFRDYLDGKSNADPAGEYTFRATIKGKDQYGYSYTLYSSVAPITMPKAAERYALIGNCQYLGAGCATRAEAVAQQIPLYLDTFESTVLLNASYYPQNATYDAKFAGKTNIHYQWRVVSGNSIGLPAGESDHAAIMATIFRPGTSIIQLTKYVGGIDDANNCKTHTFFKVCVPVTELEVTLPTYQDKIGQYYRDILPTVTAKATCGAAFTISDAFDFSYDSTYERTEYAPSFTDGYIYGIDCYRKKVAGNDQGRVTYTFQLMDDDNGLSFPLKQSYVNGDKIDYQVDLSAVRISLKQEDGTTSTMSAEWWGAKAGNELSTSYELQKPCAANFTLSQDVFVQDPSAKYITWLFINTSIPHVGDPVNEHITVYSNGTPQDKPYESYKQANLVSGLYTEDGKPIIAPYSSMVSKADSATAGEHYTSAAGAKAEANKSYVYLTDAVYEAGTYFHELQIQTNSNPCRDGNIYYFSPDVHVSLNGKPVYFHNVTYNKDGNSYLSLKYFYEVDDASYYSTVTLDNITPRQGRTPASDAKVSTGTKELPVDVSEFKWFVDANKNGKLDAGEEAAVKWDRSAQGDILGYNPASTLWWDGSFLPGVAYSAQLKLTSTDETTRLNYPLTICCGKYTFTVNSDSEPFVMNFEADNTIRTISLFVDADNPTGRDPLNLFNAANSGYSIHVSSVNSHNTDMDSASIADIDIADYLTGDDLKDTELKKGDYWLTMYASLKTGYQFDETVVMINHIPRGSFYYCAEHMNDINKKLEGQRLRILYPFSVAGTTASGSAVSGTVTSFGSATETVTIQLFESGNSAAAYETDVTGNSAAYSFPSVLNGTYTMKVMKNGHMTREYTITVNSADIKQDAKLHLFGDINGDGQVNVTDVNLARFAVLKRKTLDAYQTLIADADHSGTINVTDVNYIRFAVLKRRTLS